MMVNGNSIKNILPLLSAVLILLSCNGQNVRKGAMDYNNNTMSSEKKKFDSSWTDADWREHLTPDEYRVMRQKGTERPFSSEYETLWDSGVYVCKGCGTELFYSETKFDAHCGWPSFYQGIDKSRIREILDTSHGMIRTEVVCANCGSHLGHVFDDAPHMPTGLRYCINGISLGFKKKD